MSFFYNSDGLVRTVEIRDALRKMVEFRFVISYNVRLYSIYNLYVSVFE